jgi:hypothetical protein
MSNEMSFYQQVIRSRLPGFPGIKQSYSEWVLRTTE